ncbi:MAG: site-2 protease family protein [Clostridiales bacterium]|nr:site-2 protease family protein [Clostridiales bacterium]
MNWIKRNPILVIFLVLMIISRVNSGAFSSPADFLLNMILLLPGIVIGITVHEFMHAYSAWKFGDSTPMRMGRVTLNPLAHIEPIGIITLLFAGFGWGKPVMVNPYAFTTYRRLKNIVIDVAGTALNFVVAFLFTGLLISVAFAHGNGSPLTILVQNIVSMNLILMIFNLLPIPPLDGFGIITEIFDLRRFHWYQTFYNSGSIILLILILFGIIGPLLGPAIQGIFVFMQNVWLPAFGAA